MGNKMVMNNENQYESFLAYLRKESLSADADREQYLFYAKKIDDIT